MLRTQDWLALGGLLLLFTAAWPDRLGRALRRRVEARLRRKAG